MNVSFSPDRQPFQQSFADPSHELKKQWDETSAEDQRRLIGDSAVLHLLRTVNESRYEDLAVYLVDSRDYFPSFLWGLPEEKIRITDKSKEVLRSLLRNDGIAGHDHHKLVTLRELLVSLAAHGEGAATVEATDEATDEGIRYVRALEKIPQDLNSSCTGSAKAPEESYQASTGEASGESSESKAVPQPLVKVPDPEAKKLVSVSEALQDPELTSEQVLRLLTPTDDKTSPKLRKRIGERTGNAEELARKRDAFRAYVARLKEHAPRLTASQLQRLHQYLHLSQTVKGKFWDSNSAGYNQLMEDRALYHEYRALKTLLKNAQLPGSSDRDVVYTQISAEVRAVTSRLNESELDDAQRHALLVSANGDKPPLLRRLLESPISSAFSIVHKRSAFRNYLRLLARHAPGLSPDQGKRLHRALLDCQKVPARLFGRSDSKGYRQLMKDQALCQEYTMLMACLAHGTRMQDTPLGQLFLAQMQRQSEE